MLDEPFPISLIRPENVPSRRVAELGFDVWRGTIRAGWGHLAHRLDRPWVTPRSPVQVEQVADRSATARPITSWSAASKWMPSIGLDSANGARSSSGTCASSASLRYASAKPLDSSSPWGVVCPGPQRPERRRDEHEHLGGLLSSGPPLARTNSVIDAPRRILGSEPARHEQVVRAEPDDHEVERGV